MTEREKLIDLLCYIPGAEEIADFFLANGVAIPVRCKDCKYGIWDEEEQLWECVVGADVTGDADTYAMFHEYNEAEHFCSYGERRTDGR